MATVELVGRLLISLAVVIGLIWVVARRLRGGRRRALRTDKLIDVLGRQNLTRASSVAVVRVADRALIIGVTDSAVRVLGEIELDAVQAKLAEMGPSARRSAVTRDIPRPRTSAHDVATGEADFADVTARLDDLIEPIPATPAELAGMLSAADVEAIRARASRSKPSGPMSGSALSPATWRQTLDALRDLTVRKG